MPRVRKGQRMQQSRQISAQVRWEWAFTNDLPTALLNCPLFEQEDKTGILPWNFTRVANFPHGSFLVQCQSTQPRLCLFIYFGLSETTLHRLPIISGSLQLSPNTTPNSAFIITLGFNSRARWKSHTLSILSPRGSHNHNITHKVPSSFSFPP